MAFPYLEKDPLFEETVLINNEDWKKIQALQEKAKNISIIQKGKGKELQQRDFLSFEQFQPQYEGLGYDGNRQLRPELAKIRGLGKDGIVSAGEKLAFLKHLKKTYDKTGVLPPKWTYIKLLQEIRNIQRRYGNELLGVQFPQYRNYELTKKTLQDHLAQYPPPSAIPQQPQELDLNAAVDLQLDAEAAQGQHVDELQLGDDKDSTESEDEVGYAQPITPPETPKSSQYLDELMARSRERTQRINKQLHDLKKIQCTFTKR